MMWDSFQSPLQSPTCVSWVGGVNSSFLCPPRWECRVLGQMQGSFTPRAHKDPPVPGPSSWAGPFPISVTTALQRVPIYRHCLTGTAEASPLLRHFPSPGLVKPPWSPHTLQSKGTQGPWELIQSSP